VPAIAALFGLVFGSFLNVVIARVPAGRSLWRPGSACPACGAAIAWHDNLPLLSFLALRGRCRACRVAISWQYPVVEAVTGAAFVAAWLAFGPTAHGAVAAGLLSALIAVTVIDIRHGIIPDVITLPGILVGVLANLATRQVPWVEAAVGIAVGAGVFFLIILGSVLVLGVEGMGWGDAKLGAMLGAFLGWKALVFSLFVAVFLGGLLAVALLASSRKGRKDPIPFGPFLAAGGAAGLFVGERVVGWYLAGFAQ
jgi:leader peptidase (prepilin peptidase)/N-methyltransferase